MSKPCAGCDVICLNCFLEQENAAKAPGPCFYPLCHCYGTEGFCNHEECTYPKCDCGVQEPDDSMAQCKHAP